MNSVVFDGRPVVPSKIICIGRNFAAHAAELGNAVPEAMVVFLKPNSAIGQTLRSTWAGEALHYETEICFLVRAGRYAGVGVGLDLTRRALQSELKEKGLPWERAKAFNGSAVFSAFTRFNADPADLHVQLEVDGQCRQQGHVSQMLYKPDTLLQGVQQEFCLQDNDIIMTGTPEGVGAVSPGSHYRAQVSAGNTTLATASWQAL
ncbi:MAG: fumarylacetoacetate hydrolase family protein [Gammaproteobacteria bacterium]|nr:fumarylacetoacetate hydrolase family protein [Gammaproteobacteria bacterium]